MLGRRTWHVTELAGRRADELRALQLGFDRGTTLIDTAEMSGHGDPEQLFGEAAHGRRDEVLLVSSGAQDHPASRRDRGPRMLRLLPQTTATVKNARERRIHKPL